MIDKKTEFLKMLAEKEIVTVTAIYSLNEVSPKLEIK